jgi:ketosteroid isomerase-like protein
MMSFWFTVCLVLFPVQGVPQNPLKQGTVERNLVDRYLEALRATMIKGSTKADVDRLLELYTDDVVYEHVRFGAKVMSKENGGKGMISHLGDYAGSAKETRFEIINVILGYKIAVIEYKQIFKAYEDHKIRTVNRRKVTMLEFEGSKIRRIRDYE